MSNILSNVIKLNSAEQGTLIKKWWDSQINRYDQDSFVKPLWELN